MEHCLGNYRLSRDEWNEISSNNALSPPLRNQHYLMPDNHNLASVRNTRDLKGDQEFFFSRKLVGRPRASYAVEEIRNLDSITSNQSDSSNARCCKSDPLSAVFNQSANNVRGPPLKGNKSWIKEKKERAAKVVSSTARRVRYDHLEYDRHMPPPELIDGPIIYEKKPRQNKNERQKKSAPLWYHPIISG